MAVLRQIAQLGNPVLRLKAKSIAQNKIKSAAIAELIDDLLATVLDVDGVGIAAPQVFESNRLFIVASRPNSRYPDAPKMQPTPMLNPVIVNTGKQKESGWEGCLSIPGLRGKVPRFTNIDVEYYDREGVKKHAHFEGFIARVFQHEYDHLDGIMFTDRVESSLDLLTDKEYFRQFS